MNKLLIKKKKIFLYEFFYELTKKVKEREKNMINIYNELFNDYKKKEKKLNELEYKFNKSEEKLCTFSPRINDSTKIKKSFLKKNNKNKSFESKIKKPLYGSSYRNDNIKYFNPISDSLYNINDDIIKYGTIDNDRNNKIFLNFMNQNKKDNIPSNNNLFDVKYMNNKNKYKNYFLLNTSREEDKNKLNNLDLKKKINNKNNLSKELCGDKNNKKRKDYFLKSNPDILSKYNRETIDYTEYSGPIIKNNYENKYNTINASEEHNLNLFNDKKLSLKNKINKDTKFKSITNSNSNIKENNIYKTLPKKQNINEESKDNNYFYTFRKEKIKYNSFNNSSKKKNHKNLFSHNFKNNIKKNKKSKIPISLRDNTKFNSFNSINTMNQIYLNNYNNRICSIKKSEHDFNINNKSSTNNSSKNSKNKISLLDLNSKKKITRHQLISNLISNNNDTKGYNVSTSTINNTISIKTKTKKNIVDSSIRKSNKELTYTSNTSDKKNLDNKKIIPNLEINKYEIVNECKMNLENKRDFKNNKNVKSEKSMTLQSLSDSKMLELAEHYINNGDDSFEVLDLKCLELKKNMKKEKEYKNITFG